MQGVWISRPQSSFQFHSASVSATVGMSKYTIIYGFDFQKCINMGQEGILMQPTGRQSRLYTFDWSLTSTTVTAEVKIDFRHTKGATVCHFENREMQGATVLDSRLMTLDIVNAQINACSHR